ncbi:MAG TPA: cysteine desulfurase-like protein [Longimicrobiales bacterium]
MASTAPTAAVLANTAEIRAHFPALERIHEGNPVAYFDGPGGTQVPRQVVDAMADYLFRHNANTHWEYPTSAETDARIDAARAALADFLGAAPDEIAFGANMTTLTFHLARALGRGWRAGDEVVTTELDHHANIAPWRALEREFGVRTRMARMRPESGQLDWDDLERCITERTRLVAIGAASNALGTITDVRRAADLAHAAGAQIFVDAVHLAAHAPIDVRALDCDFLACSAYKFYGPHIGVLYGKRDQIEALDVPRLEPAPDDAPERLETGTQNHEGIVGAAAAVDFIASLASGESRRDRIHAALSGFHARGTELTRRIWNGLESLDRVRVYGPAPDRPRTSTVSFVVDGVPSVEVTRSLAARGVFVSHGDFYAATVVERLGHARDGLVRVGCACYTTDEEVDRLLEGVRAICG